VGTRLETGANLVNQDRVTGVTVPPGDAAALARALEELLEKDAWRRELGLKAQQHVLENFQMDRMASDTLALYCAVASGKNDAHSERAD
jgi:glycosyltransferase involved in cell wall biosynthesis